MATEPSSPPATSRDPAGGPPPPHAGRSFVLRLLGVSRFLMLVPIVCTFAAATALLAYGAVETWAMIASLVGGHGRSAGEKELVLASINLVDIFLLATVLYVIAIGLYELFVDNQIPVPAWLRIDDLDDLKHKLVSVVISVLAVVFLGKVLSWHGEAGIQPLGFAVAAVVGALTFFLRTKGGKRAGDEA
jgi:uncharacterized protein (TIGR00645 family)